MMLHRLFKKYLPHHTTLQHERSLQWLCGWLKKPYLWHITRHTIARGVAVGLFINFIPLPLQMLWAALLARICRANLPSAIALTWINNPFTFVPINLFIYHVGSWALHVRQIPPLQVPQLTWSWSNIIHLDLTFWTVAFGKVYLIGLSIVSISAALVGFCVIQIGWIIGTRWHPKRPSLHS